MSTSLKIILAAALCSASHAFVAPHSHLSVRSAIDRTVAFPDAPLSPSIYTTKTTALPGALSNLVDALQNIPDDFDLAVGMAILAAALTPYVLGLFFPKFLFQNFFVAIYKEEYKDEPVVRNAEIYWKLLFATQGLVQTTLLFVEAISDRTAQQLLRDSYIYWAIFYIFATLKIRYEREYIDGRLGIQLWHITVTLVLLADVFLRPEVRDALKAMVA